LLSKKRGAKPGANVPVTRSLSRECGGNCIFDSKNLFRVTPQPRILHPRGAISVPNLYDFFPYHHVTAIPDRHPATILDIRQDDLAALLEGSRSLARRAPRGSLFADGANFLELAAASQGHLHSQQGVFPGEFDDIACASARERASAEILAREFGCDPFDGYLRALRESPLLIHTDDFVTCASSWAPVFPDQVEVWVNSHVSNYLEASDDLLEHAAAALQKALQGLGTKRSVEDFNIVAHQAPLAAGVAYPRLHWHIFPRNRRREGFAEMGEQFWVIDVFPELTAAELRPFFA
jgi:diadenosine tetraphosphate (Ap4A) HIT family hydrolase